MPATLEQEEEINLKELVDRGVKLYRETLPLKRKLEELDQIKEILRKEAKGRDHDFFGTGGNIARVSQKPDSFCRTIPEDETEWALRITGDKAPLIFTLHFSKGRESSVEVNLLKNFTKRTVGAISNKFKRAVSPWVSFS